MKKNITFLAIVLSASIITDISAQTLPRGTKNCGFAQYEAILRARDPNYDKKRAEMEETYQRDLQKFELQKQSGVSPFAQYTIPVVVHVIYNSAGQNVSDTKVKANLSQLNLDWSRTNADAGSTPAAFQSVAADMQIQFCLATKDPNGNTTTGIVHKQTTVTAFDLSGGPDPNDVDPMWDYTKYFNIYVVPLGGGLFGYASYPPPGNGYICVVDDGTCGSVLSPGSNGVPYGYGRTMTHEIGHSFNLAHIWADDGGSCGSSDNVSDTPNQADATSGECPSGVRTDACSPSAPGIMYMNYMDYTDDDCLNISTAGQKARAQSAVSNYLMSLHNASATLCSSTDVIEHSLATSISFFPNPSTGEVFVNTASAGISSMDVKVYNAIGKTVLSKNVTISSSKEAKFDLSNSPDGIYFFEIKTTEGSVTKKVIINR